METLGLSPSTPKSRSRWLELFWPVIDSDVSARTAAQNAMYACFVIGALNLIGASNRLLLIAAFLNGLFFVVAGFGIRAFSPMAVWTAFVLYALNVIGSLISGFGLFSVVRIIALGLFIGGVRAVHFARSWQKEHPEEDVRRESLEGLGPAGRALALAPLKLWPWTRPLFVVYLAFTALVLLLLVTVRPFITPWSIPSSGMAPTLLTGDRVLAWNAWLMGPVQRGDVVSLRSPTAGEIWLKRVVGVPGDRIHLRNKQLVLNGRERVEPYVQHLASSMDEYRDNFPSGTAFMEYPTASGMLQSIRNGDVVVPAGYYFVLGDNRDNSLDSRYVGFISRDAITSRPFYVYASRRGPHAVPRVQMPN